MSTCLRRTHTPDYSMPRDEALARISDRIREAADRLTAGGFQVHFVAAKDGSETKLIVRRGRVEVKIEVNFVMRGTVHPVRMASPGAWCA